MTARRRLAVSALAVLTAVTFVNAAAAQGLSLQFKAASGCASVEEVVAGVANVVGKRVDELHARWSIAEATIARIERGYELEVVIVSQRGERSERRVVTSTCREASDAAIVILATSFMAEAARAEELAATASSDASAAGTSTAPPSTSAEPAPTVPLVEPPPEGVEPRLPVPPRSEIETPGAPLEPALGLRVGVDPILLGLPVGIATAVASLERKRFRLALFGSVTTRAHVEVDSIAGAGVSGADLSLIVGGALACYRGLSGRLSVLGCGGVELGSFIAKGFGPPPRYPNHRLWYAALADASVAWSLSDVALLFGIQGVFPIDAVTVEIDPEPVHETPAASVRPWLGTEMRF